jgi:hypothetical protein
MHCKKAVAARGLWEEKQAGVGEGRVYLQVRLKLRCVEGLRYVPFVLCEVLVD